MKRSLVLSVALAVFAGTAHSHEFWIEPREFQVADGNVLEADLRNGEKFKGISLSFFDNRFTRFELALGSRITPVTGRMGDTPALSATVNGAGLLIVLHETTPATLRYQDWEKFLKFARHKDFPRAAAEHDAAGWPREGFSESYTRHAKALVSVGNGEGEDRAFGLATEFVALTNPYAPGFDGTMSVALMYEGAPRSDAQVEVFDRAPDGSVSVRLHRTDARGEAHIPVSSGHDYLFDAVVLRKADADASDANTPVWETLWAALTFHVPAAP
ncbi:MAG: DUF4198 domain-containing protein [Pseudomonadota bacterium]